MRKNSYESILSAVGRVLDLAEAERFAVRNAEGGLLVEARDGQGAPLVLNLNVPELAQLLDWAGDEGARAHYERAAASNEGTLGHFLAQHDRELVGAL